MAWLADPGVRLALAFAALMAGGAAQLQQAALWPLAVYAALAVIALGLLTALALQALGAPQAGRPRPAHTLLIVTALALGAFASAGWRAGERLAERVSPALEGRDLLLTGTVAELPRVTPAATRFVFAVEQALDGTTPVRVPSRISLSWHRGADEVLPSAAPELRAGDRWRFTVRLKAPHGAMNPHGFDLELWLFERGLGASGSVRGSAEAVAQRLDQGVAHPVERLRQRVRDAILLRVADPGAAGVLAALAIGEQAAIEREDWALFRATGVAHLMAISGLHVTMFAWLAGALIGRVWRRSGRALLWLPAPHAARWGGLAAAAGYALLAGWGVPAQRTVWMIATVVVLRTAGLRWPAPTVLLAAGAVVAVLDPWALLQPGFWLSFAAVGLLMVAAPQQVAELRDAAPDAASADTADTEDGADHTGTADTAGTPAARAVRVSPVRAWAGRALAALRSGVHTQAVATIGLAPLTLLFFQQVSLVGFAANLLAIPVVTLLITPLALAGVLLPPLWSVGAWAVQALAAALGALATLPWAVWSAAAAPAWAAAAGLLGGALLVAPLPWRLRALGLPLLLPLLWPAVQRPPEGAFELVAADVGQGSAVLVRTRGHLLVYDAGPTWGEESDAGERVLLPLLRSRGEHRIDLLLLSHRDTDHVGGAAALLAALPVAHILSSLEPRHVLLQRGVPQRRCDAGEAWTWDGVHFELLHPLPAEHERGGRPNTLSCVLRVVDAAGRAALLTGDIEAAQEAALLERQRDRLPAELLLVPHHGSRTSSTAAFIEAVAPRTAIVQAGWRNRFGHPAPEVQARYTTRGIELLRTDGCGAYTRDADGHGRCQRQVSGRYWHHR